MNDHLISEDDLHAYVDDALTAVRRAQVADYLSHHPEVAKRVGLYAEQREAMRALYAPVADEPVPVELNLSHLAARRRTSRFVLSQGIAACLLLLIGAGGGWLAHGINSPTRGIGALAQEASDTYAVYANDSARPVEIKASQSAELVSWASHRMNAPVTVPDLSGAGYRLMGGRLVATPHGPAVMFMYDNDQGTRLAMLSRPMAIDKNRHMVRHVAGETTGFAWSDHGMGYDLVGPAAAANLHSMADEARRQILKSA